MQPANIKSLKGEAGERHDEGLPQLVPLQGRGELGHGGLAQAGTSRGFFCSAGVGQRQPERGRCLRFSTATRQWTSRSSSQ